jgi:hypothetical protein
MADIPGTKNVGFAGTRLLSLERCGASTFREIAFALNGRGYTGSGRELDHQARAAPKLNIMTADKTLGLLDCFGVVLTDKRFASKEMPVIPNGVSPVFCHSRL